MILSDRRDSREPPVRDLHLNSVKAIVGISAKHMALLDEYRMALGLWSETRALYSAEAAEVQQVIKHLEEVERSLALCNERTPGHQPALGTPQDVESEIDNHPNI